MYSHFDIGTLPTKKIEIRVHMALLCRWQANLNSFQIFRFVKTLQLLPSLGDSEIHIFLHGYSTIFYSPLCTRLLLICRVDWAITDVHVVQPLSPHRKAVIRLYHLPLSCECCNGTHVGVNKSVFYESLILFQSYEPILKTRSFNTQMRWSTRIAKAHYFSCKSYYIKECMYSK